MVGFLCVISKESHSIDLKIFFQGPRNSPIIDAVGLFVLEFDTSRTPMKLEAVPYRPLAAGS